MRSIALVFEDQEQDREPMRLDCGPEPLIWEYEDVRKVASTAKRPRTPSSVCVCKQSAYRTPPIRKNTTVLNQRLQWHDGRLVPATIQGQRCCFLLVGLSRRCSGYLQGTSTRRAVSGRKGEV